MKVRDLIRELQEWNENEEVMIGGWDFTQAFSIDRTSYESVRNPHDPESQLIAL